MSNFYPVFSKDNSDECSDYTNILSKKDGIMFSDCEGKGVKLINSNTGCHQEGSVCLQTISPSGGSFGKYSTVCGGQNNLASGDESFVGSGKNNVAQNQNDVVCGGRGNKSYGLFAFVGNGQDNKANNSSFIGSGGNNSCETIYGFIGNGINNKTSGFSWAFIGNGVNNVSSGLYSFVGNGSDNVSSASYSFVGNGINNVSSGLHSFVGNGDGNVSSGLYSFVGNGVNNVSSGLHSFVGNGDGNVSSGRYSCIPGGQGLRTTADHSCAVGKYNQPGPLLFSNPSDPNQQFLQERIFMVGYGSAAVGENLFSVTEGGYVAAKANFVTTGADYSEWFECQADLKEYLLPRTSVTLKGGLIIPASEGDNIIGVVSSNPSLMANTAEEHWVNKYLKNDYGSLIVEETEDTVIRKSPDGEEISEKVKSRNLKLNPLWNPEEKYIPRSQRNWVNVALLGQVEVYSDMLKNNNWIKIKSNFKKVEDRNVDLWLVR